MSALFFVRDVLESNCRIPPALELLTNRILGLGEEAEPGSVQ